MTPLTVNRFVLCMVLLAVVGCNKSAEKSGKGDVSITPAANVQKQPEGQTPATTSHVATSNNGEATGSTSNPKSGNSSATTLRHLKAGSASVVYRFGSTANEKAWTGPSGLAFMSDSKRICVLGDSPFNAILSVPDKTRLRTPNPSFDDHFQMTKVGGYEWQPPTVAAFLVDNLATHNTVVSTRDDLHKSWRTNGWNVCDMSQKGTFLAVADKLGKVRVVRLSDSKPVLDFDSAQWKPKASDDKSQFGSGSNVVASDKVRFAFSPDESKIALAVRTASTPSRAFCVLFDLTTGAVIQKIENFCPTSMLFSPNGRILATYYGRHRDYRTVVGGGGSANMGDDSGYIIRLLSADDLSQQKECVVSGDYPAHPAAFSLDSSILIARGQGGGEDSASSSFLYAFDVNTGKMLWKEKLSHTLASTLHVHDANTLFAGGFSKNKIRGATGRVYGLDLRSGKPKLILEDTELWLYAVSPDGNSFVTSSGTQLIKSWNVGVGASPTPGGASPTAPITGAPSIPPVNKPLITSEPQNDLLRSIDATAMDKSWSVETDGLKGTNLANKSSFVTLPFESRDSYELQVSVLLQEGDGRNDIHIVLPFQGKMRPFVIRHEADGVVRLSFWPKDSAQLGKSPYGTTLPSKQSFANGQSRTLTFRVTPRSIDVLLDGQSQFQLPSDATVIDRDEPPSSVRLGSWNNSVVFKSVATDPRTTARSVEWQTLAGTYQTTHEGHKKLGTLLLEADQSGAPRLRRGNGGEATKAWKYAEGAWLFDWGNVDLYAIVPNDDGIVNLNVYWKENSNGFVSVSLPKRTPDVSATFTKVVIPAIIGRWENVTSKGWAMEFLATGEALNIDPTGIVDTRGTWKDEGNGKFSARLGQNNGWEWKGTVQRDTMVVEAFLNGKPHSKSTLSRR